MKASVEPNMQRWFATRLVTVTCVCAVIYAAINFWPLLPIPQDSQLSITVLGLGLTVACSSVIIKSQLNNLSNMPNTHSPDLSYEYHKNVDPQEDEETATESEDVTEILRLAAEGKGLNNHKQSIIVPKNSTLDGIDLDKTADNVGMQKLIDALTKATVEDGHIKYIREGKEGKWTFSEGEIVFKFGNQNHPQNDKPAQPPPKKEDIKLHRRRV
jgi:hypothetical protein